MLQRQKGKEELAVGTTVGVADTVAVLHPHVVGTVDKDYFSELEMVIGYNGVVVEAAIEFSRVFAQWVAANHVGGVKAAHPTTYEVASGETDTFFEFGMLWPCVARLKGGTVANLPNALLAHGAVGIGSEDVKLVLIYVVALEVVVGINVDKIVATSMAVGGGLIPTATFTTGRGVALVGVALYTPHNVGIELLVMLDELPSAVGGTVVGNDYLIRYIEPLREDAVQASREEVALVVRHYQNAEYYVVGGIFQNGLLPTGLQHHLRGTVVRSDAVDEGLILRDTEANTAVDHIICGIGIT